MIRGVLSTLEASEKPRLQVLERWRGTFLRQTVAEFTESCQTRGAEPPPLPGIRCIAITGAQLPRRAQQPAPFLPDLPPPPPPSLPPPLLPWLSYLRVDHQLRCHGKGRVQRSSFRTQLSSVTRQRHQSFLGRLLLLQEPFVLGEVRAAAHVWRGTKRS